MKRTMDDKSKFKVIDDPDKVGVGLLPGPLTQINEDLGLDKWAHRKKDLSVVGGEPVDPRNIEITDDFVNNIANQPGDVEPWD